MCKLMNIQDMEGKGARRREIWKSAKCQIAQ